MSMTSKRKGATREREAVKLLKELGHDAYRTSQVSGGKLKTTNQPDVVCRDLPKLWIEVKSNERDFEIATKLLDDACVQAARDAEANGHTRWIVLWRKNKRGWCLTTTLFEDLRVTVSGEEDIGKVLARIAEELG